MDVDFFLDPANAARTGYGQNYFDEAAKTLKPYVDAGKVKTFAANATILPGITASLHPGHTPGSAFFVAGSQGQAITFVGDILHVAAVQFPRPAITIVHDLDPKTAARTRAEQFSVFARAHVLIAARQRARGSRWRYLAADRVCRSGRPMTRSARSFATVATLLSAIAPAAVTEPRAHLLSAPPAGQVATAFPAERGLTPADFPRMIRLADFIHAYEDLRAPGFTIVSLIVIGTRGVLIADGQGNVRATRRLLAAVARMTQVPVQWYVVGSDHADHTGGNAALPKGVTYVVHPTSPLQLARDASKAHPDTPPVIVPDRPCGK